MRGVEDGYPQTASTSRSVVMRTLANTLQRPTTWLLGGRAVQLFNSVLLSAVVVRRFGLSMVGTYAIGYIAVAFIPHILSLGLNSELPRTRRPMPQVMYVASVIQGGMFLLLLPALFLFSGFLAHSPTERLIIFAVSLSGCFTGIFNVGLTINILLRHFKGAFFTPLGETSVLLAGGLLARTGLQFAVFVIAGKLVSAALLWPRLRWQSVGREVLLPVVRQGTKYLFLDLLVALGEQLMPLILGIWAPRTQLGLYRLCQQTASAAETPGWSYVQGKYPELTKNDPVISHQIAQHQKKIGVAASALCLGGSIPLAFFAFRTPVVASMMAVLSAAMTWRYISYVNDQRLRAEGRILASLSLLISRIVIFAGVLALTVSRFGVWAGIWTSAIGAVVFGTLYQYVADRNVSKTPRSGEPLPPESAALSITAS